MARKFSLLLLLVCALTACTRESPTPPAATSPTPPKSTAPIVSPSGPLKAFGLAHVDGYGKLRFGMNAEEVRKAWTGDLSGKPAGAICYYLTPTSVRTAREFGFMVESGKFVRYDVGNDKEVAPGGGKRGMSVHQIRKLYTGRVTESPHKYIKGGNYLRIKSNDESRGVLLFESDADGKVTAWRVGQAPQVDYVEGCS